MIRVLKWSSSSKASSRNGFQRYKFLCSVFKKCIDQILKIVLKKCVPDYLKTITRGTLKMKSTSNGRTERAVLMYSFSALVLERNALIMRLF